MANPRLGTALGVIVWLLVATPALGGEGANGVCDSDGIIGTFSQESDAPGQAIEITSLTITPANFSSNLVARVAKTSDPAIADDDKSVKVWLALDADSSCTTAPLSTNFSIKSPKDGSKECRFAYDWDATGGKIKPDKGDEAAVDADAAFQAYFEVRPENGSYGLYFSDPNNEQKLSGGVQCFDTDGGNLTFDFVVPAPAVVGGVECSVQYEMKGAFAVVGDITINGKDCKTETPGQSNQDGEIPSQGPDAETTAATPTPTSGFPYWAWIIIGVGAGLILLLIVVVLLVIFLCCKKKKDPEEDVEAEPEATQEDAGEDGAASNNNEDNAGDDAKPAGEDADKPAPTEGDAAATAIEGEGGVSKATEGGGESKKGTEGGGGESKATEDGAVSKDGGEPATAAGGSSEEGGGGEGKNAADSAAPE